MDDIISLGWKCLAIIECVSFFLQISFIFSNVSQIDSIFQQACWLFVFVYQCFAIVDSG